MNWKQLQKFEVLRAKKSMSKERLLSLLKILNESESVIESGSNFDNERIEKI